MNIYDIIKKHHPERIVISCQYEDINRVVSFLCEHGCIFRPLNSNKLESFIEKLSPIDIAVSCDSPSVNKLLYRDWTEYHKRITPRELFESVKPKRIII